MRVLVAVPLLLLVAAAQAQLFDIVPSKNSGSSTLYYVRGVVTVGTPSLTNEKSALEYQGEVAFQQLSDSSNSQVYVAQFKTFKVEKYNSLHRTVGDESLDSSEESAEKENTDYLTEMRKPVKVYFKDGEVVRYEAQQDQKEWALNVYRALFTLFQNQVNEPKSVHQPKIEYYYEDGISGHCKVQYEVLSQPEYWPVDAPVFNVTKTKYLKDCKEPRPVYLHLKDVTRGCPGVCSKHKPENFLPEYKEEKTDYDMNPTPGCPVNRRPTDTLVTVHEVAQYNISKHHLWEAQLDSLDIYKLFAGPQEARSRLYVEFKTTQGPPVEQPKSQLQEYTSLHQQLPEEAEQLDIPIYSLMLEDGKRDVVEQFNRHFQQAVQEIQQFGEQTTDDQPEAIAHYVTHMVQAMSLMNAEQIRRTIPTAVQQKKEGLQHKEQIQRQLWIDILSKGGSKAAIKVAVELIKREAFTQNEARRVFQDIAAFQSYPDKDMIEEVFPFCLDEQNKLSPAAQATACVATGKIIAKACRSAVHKEPYTQRKHQQAQSNKQESSEESQEESMSRLIIEPQKRCDVQDLNKYIQRLSKALQEAHDFKEVVAYINGLAKISKPEVLPELQPYFEGTARNLKHVVEKDEDEEEAIDFIKQITLVALHNVAEKYPKEVNPIVRVIYENTTENTQTRILAFDVWLYTQPAQWGIKKVIQVAKDDESVELTNYVYTALKHMSRSKQPCDRLLARRIRDAWTAVRPFDLGVQYSHLYAASFYDTMRDYGTRAIWKLVASNSSNVPTYTSFRNDNYRGPFYKTQLSAKLLIKGADQFKEELFGDDGLFDRLADVVDAKLRQGQRKEKQLNLLKDIASGIKFEDTNTEIPKAVLLWKFFSGEAIIPVDRQYFDELKMELLQHVYKWGKNGINAHFVRIVMPTKAYHVEPSAIGFPIVHSTVHPIVLSVKLENVQIQYDNIDKRFTPEKFELKGIIHPTIISLRESRLFAVDVEGEKSPSAIVSSIKEFNLKTHLHIKFDTVDQRFKLKFKPYFDRVAHVAHCVEITLDENYAIDKHPDQDWMDYNECVKTMPAPYLYNKEIFGKRLGMTFRLNGTTHYPWGGLPIFASRNHHRFGYLPAFLKRFANQGLKHKAFSLFLKQYNQDPINEWSITFDLDDNLHHLAKQPLQQQHQQSQQQKRSSLLSISKKLFEDSSSSSSSSSESSESIEKDSKIQDMINKVEHLIQKDNDEIEETTYEKQIAVVLEGFYQNQPKKAYKVVMKKISTFDKTDQHYALFAESQQTHKAIEIYGNVSYPNIDTPFNYEPSYFDGDEMNATFVAHYVDKNSGKQTYIVEFNATKSEEQREGIQDYEGHRYYKWFQVRCLAEQKNGHTVSDACRRANIVDNYLDQMQLTVTYPQKVSPRVRQYAHKLLNLVKYRYWAHAKSDVTQTDDNPNNQLVVQANATRISPWSLLYDVEVNTPQQNVYFHNIRVKGFRPPHMQLTTKQLWKHVVYRGNNNYPCGLGKKTVHTFDNVSFPLDVKSQCKYVLTRDCSGTPDYTVVFEVLDKTIDSKKLYVQLYNTVIELTPPEYKNEVVAQVVVNGTVHRIHPHTPLTFYYARNYKVFVYVVEPQSVHDYPIVYIRTENKYFNLYYDGYSAYVYVSSHYKGDTCGVCGNNDNEPAHEFIGPHGEEYYESNEFIASYGIGSECQRPVQSSRKQMIENLKQDLQQEEMQQIIRQQQLQGRKGLQGPWKQQNSNKSPQQWHQQKWDSSEESQELRHQKHRQEMRSHSKLTSSEEEQQWMRNSRQQYSKTRPDQDSSEEQKHSKSKTRKRQQKMPTSSEEQSMEEVKDCVQERTVLRNLETQYCFSKRPVLTCSNKCRKIKGNKKEDVNFTCLSKEDPKAKMLIRKIREQRILEEVRDMPASMKESVRIPEKCVRA